MPKKKCPDCPKCLPGWLAAFGDLMSLLLCFFVLLLSMATMDAKKVDAAIGSLAGAMSILEGGVKTEVNKQRAQQAATSEAGTQTSEQPAMMVTDFNEMTESKGGAAVKLEEAEEGFTIHLPSSILFESGEVKVTNQDAILFLKRLALMVDNMPPDIELSVRGHTDNRPPAATSIYKNNWELSTARALSVGEILMESGVPAKKMTIGGNAGHRPVATNDTPEGRAKNRRVEIYFYSEEQSQKRAAQQSVLEMDK